MEGFAFSEEMTSNVKNKEKQSAVEKELVFAGRKVKEFFSAEEKENVSEWMIRTARTRSGV